MEGFGVITTQAVPRAGSLAHRVHGLRRAVVTFVETLRLALESLRAHKLRSFLTLLGVILAVTTLVSVMSVVSGLNFYVADRIANLGANVFLIDRFCAFTHSSWLVMIPKRSTRKTLAPRFATRVATYRFSPAITLMTETNVITARITPSSVRKLRNLCARNASSESFSVSVNVRHPRW